MYIHRHIHAYFCIHKLNEPVCMCKYTYIYMYMYIYIYIYIYIRINVKTCICMHLHAHRSIRLPCLQKKCIDEHNKTYLSPLVEYMYSYIYKNQGGLDFRIALGAYIYERFFIFIVHILMHTCIHEYVYTIIRGVWSGCQSCAGGTHLRIFFDVHYKYM